MNQNDKILKLSPRLPKASSLDGRADSLYEKLGKHYVAIVDLVVAERSEPDPDSDAHPTARLRIHQIEVAFDPEEEAALRETMQRIFRERTSDGTFDSVEPSGEVVPLPTDTSKPRPTRAARARSPRAPRGSRS